MTTSSPLDDVEFLARSAHRVQVLDELARESQTRSTLNERTDISQPTLGRVLGGFEDRGWVSKDGRTYALTPFGAVLAAEFGSLRDTVETIQTLQCVADYLPYDEMDFDLRELGDAKVITPQPPDVNAHVRRLEAAIRDASRIRWLGSYFDLASLPKQRELVVEQDQRQELVIAQDAFEGMLSHPDAADVVGELLPDENVAVYRYDGPIPLSLCTVDDTAVVVLLNDQCRAVAFVESDNETVHEWVTETIDDYRDRATRITPDDLPG